MITTEVIILFLLIVGFVSIVHFSITFIVAVADYLGFTKKTKYDLTSSIGWLQWEIYSLHEREKEMALNLSALASEVARVKTVHESAVKVIHSLSAELKEVSEKLKAQEADTAALDELVAKLDASTDALASAVSVTEETPAVSEEVWNTDHATTPATGGAPSEGSEGTQSGKA